MKEETTEPSASPMPLIPPRAASYEHPQSDLEERCPEVPCVSATSARLDVPSKGRRAAYGPGQLSWAAVGNSGGRIWRYEILTFWQLSWVALASGLGDGKA